MEQEFKEGKELVGQPDFWQRAVVINRPEQPRIPMMEMADLSEEQRMLAGIGASNVLKTLAHREDLLDVWLEFGRHLTAEGKVPFRWRELIILRVGLRTFCEYEWANHVPGALSAGVTSEEIEALAKGQGVWSDADAALLALVDDLCADNCASLQTWQALKATFNDGEIIELLMLIGFYQMNAGLINSLGVQAEPGRPRLGEVMHNAVPSSSAILSQGKPGDFTADIKVEGVWQLKFYHPAGTQDIKLVMVTHGDALSGTLTNDAAGISVDFTDGKVQNGHVACTTIMTQPYPLTITWDGVIQGDDIAGTATILGAAAFPFDGKRVG